MQTRHKGEPTDRTKSSYGRDGKENDLPAVDPITKLEQQVLELERTNVAKDARIRQLQTALEDITPLRKHLKRQVKLRLKAYDQRLDEHLSRRAHYRPPAADLEAKQDPLRQAHATDAFAFTLYNKSNKDNLRYQIYRPLRAKATRGAKSVLRLKRKLR